MAYIVRKETSYSASSATYTPSLIAHAVDDLLLICMTQDVGTTAISTTSTGWAMIGTQAASGGSRQAWAYKIATSNAEPNPTFSGTNDTWASVVIVVRDADTVTPINANARADWNNVATADTPALSTTADNCLVFCSFGSDNYSSNMKFSDQNKIGSVTLNNTDFSGCTQIVGSKYQYATGAIEVISMVHSLSNEGGNSWVIAVNNKANGRLRGENLNLGEMLLSLDFLDTTTISAPNSVTGLSAINGINLASNVKLAKAANYGLGAISSNEIINEYIGGFCTLTKDLSNSILNLRSYNVTAASRIGSGGFIVALVDSSNNWSAWSIFSYKHLVANISAQLMAHLDTSITPDFASATPADLTDVVSVGFLFHRNSAATSTDNFGIGRFNKTGTENIVGGESVNGAYLSDAYFSANSHYQIAPYKISIQGENQCVLKQSITVGDGGTTPTYFKSIGSSVETPSPYVDNIEWRVNESKISFTVKLGASDSFDASSGVFSTITRQTFTLDASTSTSAFYSFIGTSFIGWDVVWKTGISCNGASFVRCYELDMKGADLTNCNISGTKNTDSALTFTASGATVTNTTIDVTGTSAAYHLELGTSCTSITLADVTFTGTPGTDKIHVLATTGTVTITTSGTTSIVASDVTSEGATVVIAAPVITQSVTLYSGEAGSRVQLYDLTSSTELYNDVPGSWPFTWTDPTPYVADREIRLRVMWVDGADAKQFIDQTIGTVTDVSPALPYLVNQLDDAVYIANGIDGSALTGYAIVGTNLRIDVDDGTATWAEMYAYQVYWLSTEDGIRDQDLFIFGVDTANYLFYGGFKIKNTSAPSVPLLVTGGNGEPSSGPATDLLDTTGGTIFCNSAIVVPYSSGAEVTEQIVRDGLTSQGYTTSRANAIDTIPEDVWGHTLP